MFRLGEFQKLKIMDQKDQGLYLAEEGNERNRVLLPGKYVTDSMQVGDEISVFLYRDSEDRPVATTQKPLIEMGRLAALTVKDIGKVGAFLDWGLAKDLFLPYKEMVGKVRVGDQILVRLYEDKSCRLAASMRKLFSSLSNHPPYEIGDEVDGRIYEFGHDFGTFIAVDDLYSAMIPVHEDMRGHRIGDVVHVRVTGIKEDGKLDVSTRKKVYMQMDEDAKHVMEIIDSYAGELPFGEKSDAKIIFQETGLSKNAFKRAIGRLYKERQITLDDGMIRKQKKTKQSK